MRLRATAAASPAAPPPPHPYLVRPELFLFGLTSEIEDVEIVKVLKDCLRVRLQLERDASNPQAPLSGRIEFETLDKAEKAYATCNRCRVGAHPGSLVLSPSPETASDPRPSAPILFFKQLPRSFTPSDVFDLARPFGPVYSAALLFAPPRGDGSAAPFFKGQALVTYYDEQHAEAARNELHSLEVQGQSIAVQVYDPNRGGAAKGKGRTSDPGPLERPTSLVLSVGHGSKWGPPETPSPVGRSPSLLSKKDRALCLFNPEVLRAKVQDALAVIEVEEDRGLDQQAHPRYFGTTAASTIEAADLPDSLADLAQWPCVRILPALPAIAQRFSLVVPSPTDVAATRALMNSLEGKPPSVVKQKLGEQLFKVVKEVAKDLGVKGAPRITIELLDGEDLRALAELMHCPAVLREKVALVGERLAAR
ncbi:hypothetical protein JCM8202_002789 [Rhodotorula sphaerocarpa]